MRKFKLTFVALNGFVITVNRQAGSDAAARIIVENEFDVHEFVTVIKLQ